ncbi:MAG: class I SAM-dependent methyltransferase [Planctomycetota bacterium]|jgi:16S rRNA (guanine1516-N2)-methyltransferase
MEDDPAASAPRAVTRDGRLGLEGEVGRLEVDLVGGRLGYRLRHGGGRGQTLARALGAGRGRELPRVFDATAGLGRDAAVMAVLGCEVLACERHPLVHGLLADGLRRALDDPETAALLGGRLRLLPSDAAELLAAWTAGEAAASALAAFAPTVVYLDPMHPPRRKGAQVRKEMRLFRELVGVDDDQAGLLAAARASPVARVVVKRPAGADPLADGVATRIEGKTTCYDLYLRPNSQ